MNANRITHTFTLLFSILFTSAAFAEAPKLHPKEHQGILSLPTGQDLHYISYGEKGEKPLLIFIHGAPERAEVWRDYLQTFSKKYFTVAYTSRGYYPSSIPQDVEAYTTSAMAADTMAIAEVLGYTNFSLVGHDWGGATAWRTALNYPDAVNKLVVISNPHPLIYARAYYETEEHRELVDAYIPAARNDIAPWSRAGSLANNFEHYKYTVYPETVLAQMPWSLGITLEQTWSFDDGASLAAIYKHYKALEWPVTELNNCNPVPYFSLTVNQPALIIYGEQDRFTAKEAYTLPNNDCHPNALQFPIEDGTHFIHHTHKRKIIKKMRDFL